MALPVHHPSVRIEPDLCRSIFYEKINIDCDPIILHVTYAVHNRRCPTVVRLFVWGGSGTQTPRFIRQTLTRRCTKVGWRNNRRSKRRLHGEYRAIITVSARCEKVSGTYGRVDGPCRVLLWPTWKQPVGAGPVHDVCTVHVF